MYFSTQKGCKYGDECRFSHQLCDSKQKDHRSKPNYKKQNEERFDQFYDTDLYEDSDDQTELGRNFYHFSKWERHELSKTWGSACEFVDSDIGTLIYSGDQLIGIE
jgi:hypothetical protein